jgi:hypothetical protein
MATLQEVISNRVLMDKDLRERAGSEYDALTPEQQRAAFIHQARVIHEVTYMLQLARDGQTIMSGDKELLKHIETLVRSTDGSTT